MLENPSLAQAQPSALLCSCWQDCTLPAAAAAQLGAVACVYDAIPNPTAALALLRKVLLLNDMLSLQLLLAPPGGEGSRLPAV